MNKNHLNVLIVVLFVSNCVADFLPKNESSVPTQTQVTSVPEIITFSWLKHIQTFKHGMRKCFQNEHSIWNCFKAETLKIFEQIFNTDIIPLYAGVRLIRNHQTLLNSVRHAKDILNERKDMKYLTWFDKLALSLAKTLSTHTLQINPSQLTDAYLRSIDNNDEYKQANGNNDAIGTARLRRHRFNMIITMMFGVTALGAILVPMGFQMLSIVSGKALLLAKMALLLASINGLKRVANSGLHYGLYHVPSEHYSGYYDRDDLTHPRNVPVPMPLTTPLDLGLKK